jgi:ubiquinone biosynthesis protein UbiJ
MDDGAGAIDPPVWLRSRVQHWLDRRLAESTAAREALAEVAGRTFAIRLDGPGIEIKLAADRDRLRWISQDERVADATLVASPFDALTLARGRTLSALKKTDARLDGNIHVAEAFAALLERLSPDPEAELAGWVGDVAAHELAAATRAVAAFIRRAAGALTDDAVEFARDEQHLLAYPWEVAGYIEAVDDLREAVDRADSRLALLEARIARRGPLRPR